MHARLLHRLTCSALCLLAVTFLSAPPAVHAADAPNWAPVLDPALKWDINPAQAELKQVDGHQVLLPIPSGAYITTHDTLAGDREITAVFRMVSAAPDFKGASISAEAAMPVPYANGQGLAFNLALAAGDKVDYIYWSVFDLATPVPTGRYGPWTLPESRKTWPDAIRLRAEEDYKTVPSRNEKWMTLRYVLRQHSLQAYVDDRLLTDRQDPTLSTDGYLQFRMAGGLQLASIRVRALPPEDTRFEAVQIGSYLNSAKFAGQAIAPDSLPAGQTKTIDGVPFAFPVPDQRGNNHIDVGRSWVRGAVLSGYADPLEGDTARWVGAMAIDPARIQLSLRNARYSKLYLIAASEGGADTVPVVTAQFYRGSAGHPVNFATRVPLFTAHSGKDAIPLRLADGHKGNLFLVTIPLEPESLSAFADIDVVELELTKQVELYRGQPDPAYFSMHGAGLPSSIHVFALTLERPKLDVELTPDRWAHLFTAPTPVGYSLLLRNTTDRSRDVKATLATLSHDHEEKTEQKQSATLPPHSELTLHFALDLKKYGYHDVKLRVKDDDGEISRDRALAYLRPDTREHGDWAEGKGVIYGFWDWDGGHLTPSGMPRLQYAYDLGIESSMQSFNMLPENEKPFAIRHKMLTRALANEFSPIKEHLGVDWDPTKPDEMAKVVVSSLKDPKRMPNAQPSALNQPSEANFIGEPVLGNITVMSLPEYYGEPPYQMTPDETKGLNKYMPFLLIAGKAIKKEWPNAKIEWAYGIANFPIAFMRASKEAAQLMDGPAIDMAPFEREPELQVGQVTLQNEMWQLQEEWKKYAAPKPWPRMCTIEGPAISPARPGALTQDEESQNTTRTYLALMSYNVDEILGWPSLFTCGFAWGESHYGGGLAEPLPIYSPHVSCASFATMTRQLNRTNYVKYLPTGSLSVYCMQFRHYKTAPGGEVLHVMWTLRGTRPVTLEVPAGANLEVYDSMDNQRVTTNGNTATFTVTGAPCFIHGLTGDAKITLGEPDQSDSQPAAVHAKLANLGDGSWHLSNDRDDFFETAHYEFNRYFPGKMTAAAEQAPRKQGGKALGVHLEKQEKERFVMPYYAMLTPSQPIPIAGKASHLGMWVKANSDWGRVVYFLRDAAGREMVSVGTKDDWNCDDTHAWSQFCYDGWRYLRFELPGTAGWDGYREAGSVWWGGPGVGPDTLPELPLTLERIAITRRTNVVYVNDLLPANPADVLLGDLNAEYASPEDRSKEAVRVSNLRQPLPQGAVVENPIARLEKEGVGAATDLIKVEPPTLENDGRRCLVFFKPVADAATYDLWIASHANGSDAIRQGSGWTEPGRLLTGFRAGADQYVFVTWTAKDGKVSKPSVPLKVNLRDLFPMK